MLKLSLYGLSGAGKSTSENMFRTILFEEGKTIATQKLAQPLYELQSIFYRMAGKPIEWNQQDQVLLESIATSLRNISPTSLIDDFKKRMQQIKADVILNDDLRDIEVDYPAMREIGFIFINVVCDENVRIQRLMKRQDITTTIHSKTTELIGEIKSDYVIDTSSGDLKVLRTKVKDIIGEVL